MFSLNTTEAQNISSKVALSYLFGREEAKFTGSIHIQREEAKGGEKKIQRIIWGKIQVRVTIKMKSFTKKAIHLLYRKHLILWICSVELLFCLPTKVELIYLQCG